MLDLQRFRDGQDPGQEARVWIEAGQILSRQGELDEARKLLQAAVEAEPDCAEAWLRLARLSQDPHEREVLLQRVLAVEPENAQAQAELARLSPPTTQPPSAVQPAKGKLRYLAVGLLILAAILLVVVFLVWGPVNSSLAGLLPTPTPVATPTPTLTPEQIADQFLSQLDVALSSENWDRALEIVAILNGLAPENERVQQWTLKAHMQIGQALVESGRFEDAQAQFDRAVEAEPDDTEARRWQQTTQHYLAGAEALASGQWDDAIQSFNQAHEQIPDYGDLFTQLVKAHRRKGQAAIDEGNWDVAIEALAQAYKLAPEAPKVADLLGLAYRRKAQEAIEGEKWGAAIETLTVAHEQLPANQEVEALLATTYRQRGILREEEGKLQKSRADLEAALALRPGDAQAQAHLDRVMYRLFPPKRIEIDISRQRFFAWEGDVLVYSFLTSTGLHGRDTATGHYQVLDKIPVAWSSVWQLSMPYWLGIYYVGNIENGIHALPIRPDGSVMWGGLLGQRASYGCVILSTSAARTIYHWANIGTPVHIHY